MRTRILGYSTETIIQIIFQLISLVVFIGLIIAGLYCLFLLIKVLKKSLIALDVYIAKNREDNHKGEI
jgi:hypothetical protein